MAVVRSRLVGQRAEITLIRNHEATVNPLYGTINAPGFYDRGMALIGEDDDDNEITGPAAGGTTRLLFVDGKFTEVAPSLGGTWNNCAGGLTPWGTWLTGEEDKSDFTDVGGQPHGYMFEVSPETGETSGVPIKAMGRFDHEATAFDPIGGAFYLTEDDRNQSGLYKFVPTDQSQRLGALEQGGTLYMAKVAGAEKADLLNPSMGDQHRIEWVEIEDPDLAPQPFTEAPFDAENTASGPFVQGRDLGGLRMSRLEGIWYAARERQRASCNAQGKGADGSSHESPLGQSRSSWRHVWTPYALPITITLHFRELSATRKAARSSGVKPPCSPVGLFGPCRTRR
jgi:secreted PhoX family phosphatase